MDDIVGRGFLFMLRFLVAGMLFLLMIWIPKQAGSLPTENFYTGSEQQNGTSVQPYQNEPVESEEPTTEDTEKDDEEQAPVLDEDEVEALYEANKQESEPLPTIDVFFDPAWEEESDSFFGMAQEVNPAASSIPFSETPLKRFHIMFLIALPVAYLYNSTIFDLFTQQVPTRLNENEIQFKRGVYSKAMSVFMWISALTIALGIAWDDYRNVFTKHELPIHPSDRIQYEQNMSFEDLYKSYPWTIPIFASRF
jgi:hypothetical protein